MSVFRHLVKAGRCADGAESDAGRLEHLVEAGSLPAWAPALCGTRPGRLSGGWAEPAEGLELQVCARCAARELGALRRYRPGRRGL